MKLLTILALGLGCATLVSNGAEVERRPVKTLGLGSVERVQVSPDGRHLATAGQAGAFLWDTASGVLRYRLHGHSTAVSRLAFSPNSEILATGGRDEQVQVWRVSSGENIGAFDGIRGEVCDLSFSPDGERLVVATSGGDTAIFSVANPRQLLRLGIAGTWVNAATFTPDGLKIISAQGVETNGFKVWDATSGELVNMFPGSGRQVAQLAALGNDQVIASDLNGTISVWRIDSGELVRTIPGSGGNPVIRFEVWPEGKLMTHTSDGALTQYDVETGRVLAGFQRVGAMAFSSLPQSLGMYVADRENNVVLYAFPSGEVLGAVEGHSSSVITDLAVSADGSAVLSSGTEAATRMWDVRSGRQVQSFRGQSAGSSAAVFSPDGTKVLTTIGVPQPAAQLWERESGLLLREFKGHGGWLLAATFAPDGLRIATAAQDRNIRIWDAGTGATLFVLSGHQNWVRRLAFSPEGALLASTSDDGTTRVWNSRTGQLRYAIEEHAGAVRDVSFSPDGGELMTTDEAGTVAFWNSASGERLRHFQIPAGFINRAVYSPDGKLFATAEGWPFYVARLHDARDGRLIRVFTGSTSPIDAIAFAPDGRQLVTGGDMIRVWSLADISTGLEIARFEDVTVVRWDTGILQQAESVNGPWSTLTNAVSPLAVPSGVMGFYRVVLPVDAAGN